MHCEDRRKVYKVYSSVVIYTDCHKVYKVYSSVLIYTDCYKVYRSVWIYTDCHKVYGSVWIYTDHVLFYSSLQTNKFMPVCIKGILHHMFSAYENVGLSAKKGLGAR